MLASSLYSHIRSTRLALFRVECGTVNSLVSSISISSYFFFCFFDAFGKYVGLFFTGMLGGRYAEYLIKRGVHLTIIRKTFGILGCALPAIFLTGLSFVSFANEHWSIYVRVVGDLVSSNYD